MNAAFSVINSFIEDTCVLAMVAYLLTRGRMQALLFHAGLTFRQTLVIGLVMGVVGITEVIFPGARYPYITSTLIVAFAVISCNLAAGLIAAAAVALTTLALNPRQFPIACISVLVCALTTALLKRLIGGRTAAAAVCIGLIAQSAVFGADWLFCLEIDRRFAIGHALVSIPANGFGLLLLMIVVRDAQMRAENQRLRAEAEQARVLVTQAQLTALRARIHPHFLFNALTSIAALCNMAPERAESAIVRLSRQMRRALSADPTAPLALRDEIEQVRDYLEVEQLRLGERLEVVWEIDPGCVRVMVPAFALQTLVENAVMHGIAPHPEAGVLHIYVRRGRRHTLVAVRDNGVGLPKEIGRMLYARQVQPAHGLQIAAQQLVLLHGPSARLRLFGKPDVGTLAVFAIKHSSAPAR